MPRVPSGDAQIYYELSGAGPGLPVVLLTGLASDAHGWERVEPALGQARRVVTIDNRGAGRSDKPAGPYTMAQLAGDVVAVLDAAGIPRAHVVGMSLGGMIAQELALGHARRVRSLALIGTASRGRDVVERVSQVLEPSADLGAILRGLMPLVFSASFRDRERELLKQFYKRSMGYGVSVDGFLGQVAAVGAHDTQRRLATIDKPTLVVSGTEDQLVSPEHSRQLAAALPRARLVEIPGGTHGLNLEHSEALTALLSAWLEENDP